MVRPLAQVALAACLISVLCGCEKPPPVQIKPYSETVSGPTLRMPGRAGWAQAELDSRAQKDNATRDKTYQEFLKEMPHSTEFLALYAVFVSDELHDDARAEKLYKQALAEQSVVAFAIANYGNFVMVHYKDRKRAEELYKKALAKDPNDDTTLVLYGLLMYETDRMQQGQNYIDRAHRYGFSHNARLLVRVDFCRFVNGRKDEQDYALYQLRSFLINHFRATDWDFSPNIKIALATKHPDPEWLPKLADVCTGKADIAILKPWIAWQRAIRIPEHMIQPRNNGPSPATEGD